MSIQILTVIITSLHKTSHSTSCSFSNRNQRWERHANSRLTGCAVMKILVGSWQWLNWKFFIWTSSSSKPHKNIQRTSGNWRRRYNKDRTELMRTNSSMCACQYVFMLFILCWKQLKSPSTQICVFLLFVSPECLTLTLLTCICARCFHIPLLCTNLRFRRTPSELD